MESWNKKNSFVFRFSLSFDTVTFSGKAKIDMPLLILEEELEWFLERGFGHICFSDDFSLDVSPTNGVFIDYRGSTFVIRSERNDFNVKVCNNFAHEVLERVKHELQGQNLQKL
ncbi:hypothetical protein B1750_gp302 [Noumeavirus]|uniref:hypothetical protein n=1 Tax=Noumeavirus TaxID=1955558 RepID=UPI000982E432|nr:hypothetical protein B1750_gp302 [Noumeavirus]AQM73283.1 hypothetical protein NMV_302 [Noumeavirus]AQQ73995.1 hypothetical protein [Kurlavirus BKC-1]